MKCDDLPKLEDLESPSRFLFFSEHFKSMHAGEEFGSSYVQAIEGALSKGTKNGRITLAYVRNRFKDLKNTPYAGDCPLDSRKDSPIWVFNDKAKHFDGSVQPAPKETVMLYGMLWPESIVSNVETNTFSFTENLQSLGKASGETLNSFTTRLQDFVGATTGRRPKNYLSAYEAVLELRNTPQQELFEQLEMLAYLTHTVGNFLPIPKESLMYEGSIARSTALQQLLGIRLKERYDRMLKVIHAFVLNEEDSLDDVEKGVYWWLCNGESEDGSSNTPQLRNHIAKWIYGDCTGETPGDVIWDRFVVSNYLQDYVVHTGPNNFGEPIPYESGIETPEVERRLIQINARIIARNYRLSEAAEAMIGNEIANWSTGNEIDAISADDISFIFKGVA